MTTYCPRCGARYAEGVPGLLPDAGERCPDCGLAATDPPAMLAPSDEEEVDYDLAEWQPGERALATSTLLEADIPYRWEDDLVLVVPAVAEGEVDQLLDELEDPATLDEGADEDDDGGEQAHEAMVELFVAADRLQHDPVDADVAAGVLYAAGGVGAWSAPDGSERPVWTRIQGLASTVVTDLEEAVDEDTVAADARALREYLRDLV